MPVFPERFWRDLGSRIITASGTSQEDAEIVVDVLITGSLRGIDSHGVRTLTRFARKTPRIAMKLLRETATTALLDAGSVWGPVSARRAMEIAIEKAKKHGLGACSIVHGGWMANLTYYSLMAQKDDLIGISFAREGPVCAPWGGTKAVTGTNPMSIAIPTGGDFPIVLDFATTIVSQGRVKTQLLENKTLPEGWLIDRNGLSVKGGELSLQNFNEFWKRGGTLLPFGAYKGYGINLVIDILGGALNLSGTGSRAKGQGALMMALCIDAFVPVRKFKREVGRLMKEIKSSPVRPGFQQVLLPGEMQYRVLKKRTKEGIPIDDFSWQSLLEACKKLGIDTESLIAPYCR